MKKIFSALLCFIIFFSFPVTLFAQRAEGDIIDFSGASVKAGSWLKTQLPAAGLGDEEMLFAFLRGGFESATAAYVQDYLNLLKNHADSGAVIEQTIEETAKQALILAAAGIDIEAFSVDILNKLTNYDAILSEGSAAQRSVLVLYKAAGGQFTGKFSFSLYELAAQFAAAHNEDGGFGEGASNPLDTALAVQALASYTDDAELYNTLMEAHVWLLLRTSYNGGFEMNEKVDPVATSAAIIAAGCLGSDPAFITGESANMLIPLLEFQNEDGGFGADIGEASNIDTTVQCLLSLVAKVRYSRSYSKLYDFKDVTAIIFTLADYSEQSSISQPLSEQSEEVGRDISLRKYFIWFIAGMAVILLLIILYIVLHIKNSKRASPSKKKYISKR